jgi:aminopeptidase YwaD
VTRRLLLLLLVLTLLGTAGIASGQFRGAVAPPRAEDLLDHVRTLTTPPMEGRGSGTAGGERAAAYIADRLAAAGIKPGGDAGTPFQSLIVASSVRVGAGSALEASGDPLLLGRDFVPHGGSRAGEARAELVFAGYGVSGPGYDDYAGLDVTGKIVLVLDGDAPHARDLSASRLDKLITARRRGAAALLIAADPLPSPESTSAAVKLVSAAVTRHAAERLLAGSGRDLRSLEAALALTRRPASFTSGARTQIRVVLDPVDVRAANVIGILPGYDPVRAAEVVVVGAHYDHLGRSGGTVYPGADDNASGTAVVLELARAFAVAGGAPRTLVFVLFSGEEVGLLGSRHFVRNPVVPLSQTVAMINFDMVGRLGDRPLGVGGVATGSGLADIVSDAAHRLGITLTERGGPGHASDHAAFYGAGIPVLFFHTGTHADYHRPSDTADKIDGQGLARVAALATRVVEQIAARPRPLYAAVPAPSGGSAPIGAGRGEAFLGVSPDRPDTSDGVRLRMVAPDSAAARAGLREGDILVRLGNAPVPSFEDLRRVLGSRRPGQTVSVLYLRNGIDEAAEVVLGERP